MKLQFKTRNDKQIQAVKAWIDPTISEIVYGGAKGGGKSFLGASMIFSDALTYDGTQYFIARAELNDLRKFTQPTIKEVFDKWGLKLEDYAKFNGQDNYYNLINGSKVFLISCKPLPSDPLFERFGSMQMTRGWIEEAGEVMAAAKGNLRLSIGRWKNNEYNIKGKLLMTCNPKKGWLKREYVDKWKKNTLESHSVFIQAFASDNTYLPEDYVQTLNSEKDPVRKARLADGDWEYDTTFGSYFESEAIGDLWTNTLPDVTDSDKFMTIDVARNGPDKTVLHFWKGFNLYKTEVYQKQDTRITALRVKEAARRESIPYSHIIADDDGVGGGVVDNCVGIHGFVNNGQPLPNLEARYEYLEKQNFSNLKTQCAWIMAKKVNRHEVAITIEHPGEEFKDQLEQELSLYREKHPDIDTVKKTLITKDEMKDELSRSPDYGDAFIMRAYFTLKREFTVLTPAEEKDEEWQRLMEGTDFDPFNPI